jgi:hypothetical protein
MTRTTVATRVEDQTVDLHDELFHPIGSDQSWSESYYFYFFDPSQEVGAITRMGFRANDGWADAMHIVFLEGSRIIFCYDRRDLSRSDENLSVGGLTLARLGAIGRRVGNGELRCGWRSTFAASPIPTTPAVRRTVGTSSRSDRCRDR